MWLLPLEIAAFTCTLYPRVIAAADVPAKLLLRGVCASASPAAPPQRCWFLWGLGEIHHGPGDASQHSIGASTAQGIGTQALTLAVSAGSRAWRLSRSHLDEHSIDRMV